MRRLQVKKFITMLLACAVVLGLSLSAWADNRTGRFTYLYPLDGVIFRLYQVGGYVDGEPALTGEYEAYSVDLEHYRAGQTLAGYIERDKLTPLAEVESRDGAVVFENLPRAIYLLLGEQATEEGILYVPQPVLFSLPQENLDNDYGWDAFAEGKYDKIRLPVTLDISVTKIWREDDVASRPESITVQLLCDGEEYDAVVLNKSNNWSYSWEELEQGHDWKLVEKDVPEGYTVSMEQADGRYVLINTGKTPPDNPPPEKPPEIPNTGLLWWPVGLLATGGLALILVGLLRRRCHN